MVCGGDCDGVCLCRWTHLCYASCSNEGVLVGRATQARPSGDASSYTREQGKQGGGVVERRVRRGGGRTERSDRQAHVGVATDGRRAPGPTHCCYLLRRCERDRATGCWGRWR